MKSCLSVEPIYLKKLCDAVIEKIQQERNSKIETARSEYRAWKSQGFWRRLFSLTPVNPDDAYVGFDSSSYSFNVYIRMYGKYEMHLAKIYKTSSEYAINTGFGYMYMDIDPEHFYILKNWSNK